MTRRRLVPAVVGAATLAALLFVIHPSQVLAAVRGFDLRYLVGAIVLTALCCAVQGARWHFLLRAAGIRMRFHESVLISVSGQSVSAVLPLGDLTRALFASQATGASFGAAAATVTVQEMTFTTLLVLCAAPALLSVPGGWFLLGIVLGGIAATLAVIIVPAAYRWARRLLGRLPGSSRLVTQADELRRETVSLLIRPVVTVTAVIDLVRVLLITSAFLLVLRGLHLGLGWPAALLAVAVAYVGGALSFLPGGIGANEASAVAVLVGLGVGAAPAAAAALIQRGLLTGVPSLTGLLAYTAVHRRLHLGSLAAAQPAGRSPARPGEAAACEAAA
ncbi:MAG: lysylphosphatidylglycerol synthase transmembrane domain-containing protein [Candidatus Dormibacteria bacterium]